MPTATRRTVAPILLFLGFTILLCAIALLLGGGREQLPTHSASAGQEHTHPSESETAALIPCVVIDAGHGGEDGGTSSAAGLSTPGSGRACAPSRTMSGPPTA